MNRPGKIQPGGTIVFNPCTIAPVALLLFMLFIFAPVGAQQEYNDTSLYTRSIIFDENFDSNENNWITDNSWLSGRVADGVYSLKCRNYRNATGMSYRKINSGWQTGYEIEARLSVIKGSGGLIFGMTESFDHYRVEVTSKNDVTIVRNTPGSGRNEILFTGRMTPQKLAAPVKISVRKTGEQYHLFIDEIFATTIPDLNPEGELIGFNVGLGSEIEADYLRVNRLEVKPVPVMITEQVMFVIDTVKPDIDIPAAPVINWISPTDENISLDAYTARVRAGISSGTEVSSVLVYVNGESQGEAEVRMADSVYIAEKNLALYAGNNDVYMIATNSSGASKSATRHFINPAATLPVISWENPAGSAAMVGNEALTIRVCIASPSGIDNARVIVNGEERGADNIFRPSGPGECIKWQKPVILRQGENSIYVIASNGAGTITSEQRIVRFNPVMEERRIALVIGNARYGYGTDLRNPANDASLMEATLKELGFDVIRRLDTGRDSMMNSIREFSRKLVNYNVALFYYAGHGLQVEGVNYLIPVDAKLENREDCKWEAVSVDMVTEELKRNQANTNIVILDACRNNPYRSWARGEEEGFRALSPVLGTIISFATSEGATAADGTGSNGLFTEELVKQMMVPQPIEGVFKNTRRRVMERSNNQQTPVEWSYLTGEFYFKK